MRQAPRIHRSAGFVWDWCFRKHTVVLRCPYLPPSFTDPGAAVSRPFAGIQRRICNPLVEAVLAASYSRTLVCGQKRVRRAWRKPAWPQGKHTLWPPYVQHRLYVHNHAWVYSTVRINPPMKVQPSSVIIACFQPNTTAKYSPPHILTASLARGLRLYA